MLDQQEGPVVTAPWLVTSDLLRDDIAEAPSSIAFYRSNGREVARQANDKAPDQCRFRAWLYNHFLQIVVTEAGFDKPFEIELNTDDGVVVWPRPLFCFHKHRSSADWLLPDLDFLVSNFYTHPMDQWGLPDSVDFTRKEKGAAFAGSTTGGGLISMDALARNAVPRVRAARFFRDAGRADVSFDLTNLAQCDPAAEAALRAEGFGGPYSPWSHQLRKQVILSLDGNGAACSRVAVALMSNSALVKYRSDEVLHYCHLLRDREHYVSVGTDEEVLHVLDEDDGLLSHVAHEGKAFADLHLTRRALIDYTVQLFEDYVSME